MRRRRRGAPALESAPRIPAARAIRPGQNLNIAAPRKTWLFSEMVFARSGVFVKLGPTWSAELKEKNKKRVIVLSEMKDGKLWNIEFDKIENVRDPGAPA